MALQYLPILPSVRLTLSSAHFAFPTSSFPLGVAPSLSPGPLKDRVQLTNPFSGDPRYKEHRRGPSSPNQELSLGGPNLFKARRHSDADKPKGKRPCKTKHTGQKERERERRKEAAPGSPGQRTVSDLGTPEDDKVRGNYMA